VKASITVLGGDGIGPEVAAEGVRCLEAVAQRFGHQFTLTPQPFGGVAIDHSGEPLPQATLDSCLASDAILLGAIGGPNIFGVLAQRLRAGHMICLLCDRDLTESGVEVDFFGEKARMAAGPAALAVQTGASLRAVTLFFTEGGWAADVGPDIPVPAEGTRKEQAAVMTQQLATAFEKGITDHPQDWHMLQRVFISDLDPRRLPAANSGINEAVNSAGPPAGNGGLCASASSAPTPGTYRAGCSPTSAT